jgi:hemerythrin superfamily protein
MPGKDRRRDPPGRRSREEETRHSPGRLESEDTPSVRRPLRDGEEIKLNVTEQRVGPDMPSLETGSVRQARSRRGRRALTKATTLLKRDHATIKHLFHRFENAGEQAITTKQSLFDRIRVELTLHADIEEALFYPALRELRLPDSEEALRQAVEEHRLIRLLVEELSGMNVADGQFSAKMKVLGENTLHHADQEEKTLFLIAMKLGMSRLESLGAEMEKMKRERTGGVRSQS